MLAYLPKFYPDELVYSWVGRYYCHTTPICTNALEDLFGVKCISPNVEFIGKLKDDIKELFDMKSMVINHTIFPMYRFTEHNRLNTALIDLSNQTKNSFVLLPLPQKKEQRFLRFCRSSVTWVDKVTRAVH